MRHMLSAQNYQFDKQMKFWDSLVDVEGFSVDNLRQSAWNRPPVKVEVFSESGELLHSL